MGAKRRSLPVLVELDVDLRGVVTVVLDEADAERLRRRVMRESVSLAELGAVIDWNEVARAGDGGFAISCALAGRLS